MKILLVSDTYENQICGVSSSIDTLKEELINRGHDVRVLLLSKDNKSRKINNDYLIGSFSMRLIDFRQSYKFNDGLIDEIILWNPDIVHIQTEWYAGRVGRKIAKNSNAPYINTNHTSWEDFTIGLIPISFIRKLISKKLLTTCYRDSSAIVVLSDKMIHHLNDLHITLPTYLIPTGVDIDNFNQDLPYEESTSLKSKLNLKNDSKILVFIGRVALEKNLDELIGFLPDLVLQDSDIRLLIVGEGPHLSHLKNKVRNLGMEDHVIFAGVVQTKDTYKYYKIGDIFVSASTCETQGITYMEALASSLPLVCRDDEVLDNVLENGFNGFTYTNKDEFIDSIIKIFDNEEMHIQLKKNAFKSSLKFSKEKFGEEMESLYFSILD